VKILREKVLEEYAITLSNLALASGFSSVQNTAGI
jgi:hypothetical protein